MARMSAPESSNARFTMPRSSKAIPGAGLTRRLDAPPVKQNSTQSSGSRPVSMSNSVRVAARLPGPGTGCSPRTTRTFGTDGRSSCGTMTQPRAIRPRDPATNASAIGPAPLPAPMSSRRPRSGILSDAPAARIRSVSDAIETVRGINRRGCTACTAASNRVERSLVGSGRGASDCIPPLHGFGRRQTGGRESGTSLSRRLPSRYGWGRLVHRRAGGSVPVFRVLPGTPRTTG